MRRDHLALQLLPVLILLSSTAALAAFAHPGLLNNQAELNFMATQVNGSQQPWLNNFNDLNNHISDFFTGAAKNVGTLDCADPNSASCTAWRRDARAAYLNALHWVVNGNTPNAYGTKAGSLLTHAANTVKSFSTSSETRLKIGRWTFWYIAAAEIIKHSCGTSCWSTTNQNIFNNWLANTLHPRLQATDISSGSGTSSKNGWAANAALTRLAMGVFLDDQVKFDKGLTDIRSLIRFYIGSHSSGEPAGFAYETCRKGNGGFGGTSGADLPHTQQVFGYFLRAAEIAKKQGIDLFSYTDPADNAGIETTLLYHDQWIGFNHRSGSTSSGWPCAVALGSTNTNPEPSWQIAANHYGDASFVAIANYCDTVDHAAGTRECGVWTVGEFENFFGVTHRYNSGGGATPDTSPPTAPTLALAP